MNYKFYTEDADGNRTFVCIGAYKDPKRSAQWKSLTNELNEGNVYAIGYEIFERKQNFYN